jgi:hypothetical protein
MFIVFFQFRILFSRKLRLDFAQFKYQKIPLFVSAEISIRKDRQAVAGDVTQFDRF